MQEHSEDFKIGHITIPELPGGLNRNFKTFYEFVGNPKKEVYIRMCIKMFIIIEILKTPAEF